MRKTKQEKLIEYEIVKRASEGDVDAINLVFAHYESYIRKFSLRPYTDEFGMTILCSLWAEEQIGDKAVGEDFGFWGGVM